MAWTSVHSRSGALATQSIQFCARGLNSKISKTFTVSLRKLGEIRVFRRATDQLSMQVLFSLSCEGLGNGALSKLFGVRRSPREVAQCHRSAAVKMSDTLARSVLAERLLKLAQKVPQGILQPDRRQAKRLVHFSFEEVCRVFDSGLRDDEVPVVLYRDPALWCPYCQRVQFYLEERKIPYRTVHIPMRCYETEENPKPRWYLDMVPSGLLPAVKLQPSGALLTESMDIMEFFEEHPMFSQYPAAYARSPAETRRKTELLRLERRLFSDWLRYLTGSTFLSDRLREQFLQTMDAVEYALRESPRFPFLSVLAEGNEHGPGLVDCAIAPFLERIEYSIPFWKGIEIRGNARWPRLEAWFQAIEERPSYLKANAYSTVLNLPPQIGRCTTARSESAEATRVQEQVLHEAERTPWVEYSSESTCPATVRESRLEAAAAIIRNFSRIVNDMRKHCRDNEPDADSIEVALCSVAQVLIHGTVEGTPPVSDPVARGALEHIRQRVCVPRDLNLNASKQFYGAINALLAKSSATRKH
jgi:glutathione S-transferase